MANANFKWLGEVPSSDDRLCQFDTPEHGVRAGCINLLAYYLTHGLRTVDAIISRYAPLVENDTAAYIEYMCKCLRVQPDAPINLTDPEFLQDWVAAQIKYEQGENCCTPAQIAQGVKDAIAYRVR